MQARSTRTQAETRLRNLFELAADGHASVRDKTFADMLADARSRLASLSAAIDLLEAQYRRSTCRITPDLIDRFSALIRDGLRNADPAMRKGYVRMFVSEVTVDDATVQIRGSKDALAHAVSKTAVNGQKVPSFDREWCRKRTRIARDEWSGRRDSSHGCFTTPISMLERPPFGRGSWVDAARDRAHRGWGLIIVGSMGRGFFDLRACGDAVGHDWLSTAAVMFDVTISATIFGTVRRLELGLGPCGP